MSLNIRGFGRDDNNSESKFGWFRKLRMSESPDAIALQETKIPNATNGWVESIWGSSDFGFIQKPKVGKAGGMMVIWDTRAFKILEAAEGAHFLALKGKWFRKDHVTVIVNVYGPHTDEGKVVFWDSLSKLMNDQSVEWILCGDFNEVRFDYERRNCEFHEKRAELFNNLIDDMQLIEIPMNGKKYTRISDDGVKGRSDHCPLILKDGNVDFGPKPFKIFDIWMEHKDIEDVITFAWNKEVKGSMPDCIFRDKLKNVKNSLREWSKLQFGDIDKEIEAQKKDCIRPDVSKVCAVVLNLSFNS
ncbi:uncharacterized protein [Rutidosis leptorrhynchoides]|uniref:uncharacterized protein n=1 Tax=Rutidosis leptorrhynchoides TaxID=125765 RepID=UPI003A98E793